MSWLTEIASELVAKGGIDTPDSESVRPNVRFVEWTSQIMGTDASHPLYKFFTALVDGESVEHSLSIDVTDGRAWVTCAGCRQSPIRRLSYLSCATDVAILHLSDRNSQDKYFEAPIDTIRQLRTRVQTDGKSSAWGWWMQQVDYDEIGGVGLPIRLGRVDMRLDVFFLDFLNFEESIDEWDL